MKTLDKAALISLRKDIDAALQAVATKHGIAIRTGDGNYSGTNAMLKLEISIKDENGATVTKEAAAFKRNAAFYGFKPEDLGRTFTVRGTVYTLAGMDGKSYKYPMLATASNGKTFKLPLADVQRALGVPAGTGVLGDMGTHVPGISD